MHRAGAQNPAAAEESCALRGNCSEPMAALAALLWNQGVLTDQLEVLPHEGISIVRPRMHDPIVNRPDTPDPPPPRA